MIEVVTGYNNRSLMLLIIFLEQMFDDRLRTWIEEVERFVQYQLLRVMKHGRNNSDLLLITCGVVAD